MKGSPTTCEIRVEGQVDELWEEWFEGMRIDYIDDAETVILGELKDQTALHGVVDRIRDLGLILISFNRIDGIQSSPPA